MCSACLFLFVYVCWVDFLFYEQQTDWQSKNQSAAKVAVWQQTNESTRGERVEKGKKQTKNVSVIWGGCSAAMNFRFDSRQFV